MMVWPSHRILPMNAFLIALPHWPTPTAALTFDGLTLQPKAELHVTLASSALVAELAAATAGAPQAWLASAWAQCDPRVLRTGQYWLLHKHTDKAPWQHGSWSVIETVLLPGQPAFQRALERRLGRQLPVPPAHVTWYVAGRPQGIGVPRTGLLRRYQRRPLTAAQLPAQ
jgi:hypothetical protein